MLYCDNPLLARYVVKGWLLTEEGVHQILFFRTPDSPESGSRGDMTFDWFAKFSPKRHDTTASRHINCMLSIKNDKLFKRDDLVHVKTQGRTCF